MNTISCIIVDDEPLAVKLLESYVNRTPSLRLIGSFTDSVEAVSTLKSTPVQLLFLDIQMPDMSGMELARLLPAESRVIFTTAFKEYAFESYEVCAIDFLLKPIRYSQFLTSIEKALHWFSLPLGQDVETKRSETVQESITLFIRVDGEFRQIVIQDIIYVCAMKDYVMFYLTNEHRPLVTHLTMKSVENMLPSKRFMRVNRSFIVSLDKIIKVDRNDCIYIGKEIIHVTDAYRSTFLDYINSNYPGTK